MFSIISFASNDCKNCNIVYNCPLKIEKTKS